MKSHIIFRFNIILKLLHILDSNTMTYFDVPCLWYADNVYRQLNLKYIKDKTDDEDN